MRWNLFAAIVLVTAVVGIYAQTTEFGLVRFDDGVYVSGNIHLSSGLSRDGVRWAFSGPFASNYFPLTLMSHMLDRSLFGAAYGGHHFTSAAIHALNAVGVFFVLLYMTGARIPSAIVAALFAVHPLNVESVAWIAERKNVLSTTFWILSIGAYAAYARRGGVLRYLTTAILLAAGLLSKPMLVTLPLVFLLLDYWPLNRIVSGRKVLGREFGASGGVGAEQAGGAMPAFAPRSLGFLVLEKLPLLTLSVASSWMTLHVQRSTVRVSEVIEWWQRLANGAVAYARYLGNIAWPSDLAILYPHPYVPAAGGLGLELWQIVCSVALLIALSVVATRRRYLTVGWLWFVGTLVPTIGIVQVGNQALADRYAYVPAIGVFIATVWAGSEWLARIKQRSTGHRAIRAVGVAALLAFGVAAHTQAQYWRDTVSLFEHVLEVTPRNPKIRYNLANEYRDHKQYELAIRHYQVALESDPETHILRVNLANSLKAIGRLDEAVEIYQWVLAREPGSGVTHNNLGATLLEQGRVDAAITALERALEIDPMRTSAHINLGKALRERGDNEAAATHFMNAIQSGSKRVSTWRKLGESLVAAARLHDALWVYRQAVTMYPDDPQAQTDLAELLAESGELDQAIAAYREALRADPQFRRARVNLKKALQGSRVRPDDAIHTDE